MKNVSISTTNLNSVFLLHFNGSRNCLFLVNTSLFIPKFASSSPNRLGDDEVLSGQTLDVEGLSCSVKWEWNPTGTDGIVSPAYDNDDCKMR